MNRFIFLILVIEFIACSITSSYAASQPAYTGGMNNAIGSIIEWKGSKKGFQITGPEIPATNNAIAQLITQTATGIAVGGVAAVAFPEIAIGVGLSSVLPSIINLGIDGALQWLLGDDKNAGKVKVSGSALPTGVSTDFPSFPPDYATLTQQYGFGSDLWFRSSITNATPRHIRTVNIVCPDSGPVFCNGVANPTFALTPDSVVYDGTGTSYSGPYPGTNGYWSKSSTVNTTTLSSDPKTGQPTRIQYGTVWDFQWSNSGTKTFPGYVSTYVSPPQAISDTPESYLNTKLSDGLISGIVNALWQKLPPCPQCIPYDPSNPVTPGDVGTWRAQNPQYAPTVGNFFEPPAPAGSPVKVAPPSTSSGTGSTNPTGSTIDLGADPHIPQPMIEIIPTAGNILDPVFGSMSGFNNWAVPAHQSQCPVGTFSVWGDTFTIDAQCTLMDQLASKISTIMSAFWLLVSLFIVLKA